MKHLKFVYIFIIVCVVRGEFCAPPSPFLAAFRGPFNIDVKCIWIASGQQLNFRLALNSQSIEYWAASCHTSPYFLLYQNNVCFHSAAARQGIINRTSYVGRLEMCNILWIWLIFFFLVQLPTKWSLLSCSKSNEAHEMFRKYARCLGTHEKVWQRHTRHRTGVHEMPGAVAVTSPPAIQKLAAPNVGWRYNANHWHYVNIVQLDLFGRTPARGVFRE